MPALRTLLVAPKFGASAVDCELLAVGAGLGDAALLEDDNAGSAPAVGDHDDGFALDELVDGALNFGFGRGVDRGRGFAKRSKRTLALVLALREAGLWPPVVPSVVLVECLQGHARRGAIENRFLKTCDVTPTISETVARRAALLRRRARRGSAVDALVVASAEPGGTVVTTEAQDLEALAAHAQDVRVVTV